MTAPRVDAEWATLREIVVGRPFYRIPKPYPEALAAEAGDALWRKVKAHEGQTLRAAMPRDFRRCSAQMNAIVGVLEAAGVRVHRVPAFVGGEEGYLAATHPESLLFFPRDPLLVAGGQVVELCQRDARRRRERAPLRRLLRRLGLAAAALTMPLPMPPEFEGDPFAYVDGGDCLINGDEIMIGVRANGSSESGAAWLEQALSDSHRVTRVPLAGRFAHLDLALGLLRPGLGIVCRDGLPAGLPDSLRNWEWIDISDAEARRQMAANVLPLDAGRVLLPERAERLVAAVRARGHAVVTVPFDTVTAFGGGLRCWSQALARYDRA